MPPELHPRDKTTTDDTMDTSSSRYFKISRIFYAFLKNIYQFHENFFLFYSSDSSDEDDDSEEDANLAPPKLAPVSKGMCHKEHF